MKKMFIIIYLSILTRAVVAGVEKHDFTGAYWAQGRSCLICHSLKNNLPKFSPPGTRVVDLSKLEPEEQAGYEANSNNVICLVCHQTKHSVIVPRANTNNGNPLPAPQFPGSETSGTQGSTNARVINRGANSYDCLKCHDLHNKESDKMLKVDYWQN